MNDHLDSALRDALRRASLPTAPETLRDRLQAVAEMPPRDGALAANRSAGRRLAILIGLVAALTLAAAVLILPIGGPPQPSIAFPTTVEGLVAMTVSEALAAHTARTLPEGRAAVHGYWSDRSSGRRCLLPRGNPGELEIYCVDGEWGITEQDEPILVAAQPGHAGSTAEGPHLTPWFPEGLPRAAELFGLPIVHGQRYPPVPILVLGHFDDPRAGDCRTEAQQLCRDRLVIDRIVEFDPRVVPTPGVTPTPTPFPDPPPSGYFDRCGEGPYSFVGWTTEAELGLDSPGDGHVWAIVTSDVIKLTEDDWQPDPNGSRYRYQLWGRRICMSPEHLPEAIMFHIVPGSAYVLWDDGLKMSGENPSRP